MKLDETKLQEVVEKIAYQQFGAEQIDDLCAKIGILNDYVQEQLRLFAVVGRSEQLFCSMAGKGFCPYEYENGKCKVEGKCTNHTTKKS
jgi:hypothetical protein